MSNDTESSARSGGIPAAPIALALVAVWASNLAQIAGDTLFVSAFSLGDLSRFLGVSAVVRVAAALAYAYLSERAGGSAGDVRRASRFDGLVLSATAVLSLGAATLAHAGTRLTTLLACGLTLVLPPLLPLIAFNAATATLAARHAKRVLPLIAAAATLGSIGAGGAATLVSRMHGVPSLLVLGAILSLAAVPLVLALGARAEEPVAPPVSRAEGGFFQTLRGTFADVRTIPSVRVVVVWGALGALVTTFIDYTFKASLKTAYDRDAMAAFLGVFNVVSNAVVLLLQLVFAGRVVGRLGVGRALVASPAALAVAGAASAFAPPVIGGAAIRLSETLVRYGIANSVADVLLVPLPRPVRTRAKVVVKGSATPLGALAAGAVLSLFGEAGPDRWVAFALIVGASALTAWALRDAPRAYASALGDALVRGRAPADLGPQATALFRGEVKRLLALAVHDRRVSDAVRTLSLMSDRFFGPEDVAPAIAASDADLRRFGVLAAARLTSPGRGVALLTLVPADDDPVVERAVLVAAREHGGLADVARREHGRARASRGDGADVSLADLWGECVLHEALDARRARDAGGGAEAQARIDATLKLLRKAAKSEDGPQRAAALRSLGLFGDRRAEKEVMTATASKNAAVYREAATAAVALDLPGVVPGLVARLIAGPHASIAGRVLELAGPRAVRELIQALPVSRGEGAVAPTAVAEGRIFSGTVRAARALARMGPAASADVLPMFGGLGHRARVALARAFASKRFELTDKSRPLVEAALETLVTHGEVLSLQAAAHGAAGATGRGLLSSELARRIGDTREAVVDLVTSLGDRAAVLRARTALERGGRERDDALELLETLVPASVGSRVTRLFLGEVTRDEASRPLEGWLLKCRKFDARELPWSDPMLGVLEKVLLLRDVPLFAELSGEELYPVAEIASVTEVEQDDEVVKQGDPSDDLYVVVEGALRVVRDGTVVDHLGVGQAFGELGVLDGEPRSATVAADARSRLLRIPRVELEALLDESPELAKGIIKTLLGYVRRAGRPSTSTHQLSKKE
jgi:hypothetical protein